MGKFADGIAASNDRAKENMHLIFLDAVQTTFHQATERQASMRERVGPFELGKVPVDTGFLIGTAEFRINDMKISEGLVAKEASEAPDFATGLLQASVEDAVSLVFTAPYAARIEYGFYGSDSKGRAYSVPGRLYLTTAALNWSDNVAAAISKFS